MISPPLGTAEHNGGRRGDCQTLGLSSGNPLEERMAKNWYNGFSPEERSAKSEARRQGKAPIKDWKGHACSICGDASEEARVKGHSESYATPYKWNEPDLYTVCKSCHTRLHTRFRNPARWKAFFEFVRRGWYGREVSTPQLNKLLRLGASYPWPASPRENDRVKTDPWWERLSTDPKLASPPS